MKLIPIGYVKSPYKEKKDAPKQGRMRDDSFEIQVLPEYTEGLKEVESASHLIILFWCDKVDRNTLTAHPPWDNKPRGVFATRSPARPNPVAVDVVDLVEREGSKLKVKGMDALDGTAVIDIKPYTQNDSIPDARLGWLEEAEKSKNN